MGRLLKGNRGVFTRRAVRLIGGTESRAIAAHYDADPEFQESSTATSTTSRRCSGGCWPSAMAG